MAAGRVKVLEDKVINKIAAGEVVERPASVVKELVENALDAGSTEITVEIKGGGKNLIRVADNGHGMTRDDVLLAVERHATSKIRSEADLTAIGSLGFRGEALPSIGAVSQLSVVTRTADEPGGTRLTIAGGTIRDVTDSPRSVGTTIEAAALFNNLPARRKFLKSAETELRHVSRTMNEFAYAYPRISFTFLHDGKELFRFAGTEAPAERMRAIMGGRTADAMVPVEYSADGITVHGFAGKPEAARKSQQHKLFFVNRRVIANRVINHAVTEAYRTLLQKGLYPVVVLFLDVKSDEVDVNVHPTKREVRFYNERGIHQAVLNGVRSCLMEADLIPQTGAEAADAPSVAGTILGPDPGLSRVAEPSRSWSRPLKQTGPPPPTPQTNIFSTYQQSVPLNAADEPVAETARAAEEAEHIWQLHHSFIFAQIKGGVLIIDQHAAHERILYEEALASLEGTAGTGQQLLFPSTIELSHPEFTLVEEIEPLLNQMGFSLRTLSGKTVVVDAIPTSVKNWNDGEMLMGLLDDMQAFGKISSGIKEKLVATYACRAAIKAGDPLKPREMEFLINRLFGTSNPYTCPHGRPAVIKMTLADLAAKFGR